MENLTTDIVNDIKKGYITGFFDAEGTVGIRDGYALRVSINQTHKTVLERINNEFKMASGIQIHTKEGYDKKGVHIRKSWGWRLTSDNTIPFLEYVYTHSIEKKIQIELALKYQKEIYNNHRNFRLSKSEIEQRNWFKNKIQELKHETPTEQELKSYNNEIKKLSISKDIRDGKQGIIFGTIDDLYKTLGINTSEPETINKQHIPKMTNYIEIGYLSGFFDGEGYVGITKSKGNYSLQLSLGNTNFDLLKIYETKFGGNIVHAQKTAEHYKECYQWYITGFHILPFLKYIQNTTIVKSRQIQLSIEFQEWHNQIKIIKTPEQKKKAEWYYNTLKELKKEDGEKIFNNNICKFNNQETNNKEITEYGLDIKKDIDEIYIK